MRMATRTEAAPLLAPYRQDQILQAIVEAKSVTVAVLARRFQVTPTTIRRDLRVLEARGLLQRAHGGAVACLTRLGQGPPMEERSGLHAEEKERIGAAAAALVEEGETVVLDAGTTTLAVARHLAGRSGITVVTVSLGSLAVLGPCRGITTISVGGVVSPRTGAVYGHIAEQMLRDIHADRVFLSAGGISIEHGLTVPALELVPIKQAMIASSRNVTVVADSSKLGQSTVYAVCGLDRTRALITDRRAPGELVEQLRARGVEVLLV